MKTSNNKEATVENILRPTSRAVVERVIALSKDRRSKWRDDDSTPLQPAGGFQQHPNEEKRPVCIGLSR